MTRREILLILGALALVGGLAWDRWPTGGVAVPPGDGAAPEAAAVPDGLNPLAARGPQDLAALAAHPLFAPDRQPPAPVPVAEIAEPAPDAPMAEVVEAPPPIPVLQGVILTPAPGGAYVSDGAGGASVFLRPGQSAFGLTLEEVAADHALFMTAEGEVELPLTEAPRLPAADAGQGSVDAEAVEPMATDTAPAAAPEGLVGPTPDEIPVQTPDQPPPDDTGEQMTTVPGLEQP